jgi:hypothetical protein
MLLLGAAVDGMGWRPGGTPLEVVKLKAARTTVSPAAAQAAANMRRKNQKTGSVIESVLPAIMRGGRRCAMPFGEPKPATEPRRRELA